MSAQLWRRTPDSSALTEPRTFVRVFVGPEELEEATRWYERTLGMDRDLVMPYPEKDLTLHAVGGFLIIGGTPAALAPFQSTTGTLLVSDLEPYLTRFRAEGLTFVQEPFTPPVGRGFTVRHPDGTVIEYVHHRPTPAEQH
ncbi:catechol 2,3-dioxygenase-like lactoylglutathione lyase family enzyme [Saccharopolyspora lacisalsi]|uniref:Catechol 2,3-dioxygenase-like lactoylglutathione lyase family enzyme n=1 Tax=Halosaccharopolyspora lacisalsi TaxID=1000566 RepID=A0A839DU08_9PSEU|nr:VOC family protein [Halosaccharopolyspora lacisalsi]MBA8823766.1 catechol 2,3-dioxygenase-like lactoylglutathione lyase family enzyme [Halosaccharopolyspora lacisalsi]